jgi:hypothetical protein
VSEDIPAPRIRHESPDVRPTSRASAQIGRPAAQVLGWLRYLADSGPSALEGDEVAHHRRHRATRRFVGRRGANVAKAERRDVASSLAYLDCTMEMLDQLHALAHHQLGLVPSKDKMN